MNDMAEWGMLVAAMQCQDEMLALTSFHLNRSPLLMLYAWFSHCWCVDTWMEAWLSRSTSVTSLTAFQAKSLPGNLTSHSRPRIMCFAMIRVNERACRIIQAKSSDIRDAKDAQGYTAQLKSLQFYQTII